MFPVFLAFSLLPKISLAFGAKTIYVSAVNVTQSLSLAVSPTCGSLNSTNFTELNTGVNLKATKTVVAFGDSWTANGSNGTIPFPPVLYPPNPSAGSYSGRGRASNGYVWVEDLGNSIGAKVIDYAVGGAVVDLQAYNSTKNGPVFTSDNQLRVDFVEQTSLFLQQGRFLADLNPDTTLYTVQFGINDHGQYAIAGGDWNKTTETFLQQLSILQAHGAKNFLIHWVYFLDTLTDAFQTRIHDGICKAHQVNGTNFATVNLQNLFGAINTSGSKFGYTNTTCLALSNSTDFGCKHPESSVFYIRELQHNLIDFQLNVNEAGHPSAVVHKF
ncbi:hypothetical protein BD410DRAFT_170547 [Rickenella mellea]|uniref:Carbohydrate esterase family 16 protein n=1 Tax=Rickenella mellea TaxID=50990 RepID=A0A4Y7Q8L0_9AGAM|nr:hypothetical protein BD410DRAFT_170547 [Rickenella mellea]